MARRSSGERSTNAVRRAVESGERAGRTRGVRKMYPKGIGRGLRFVNPNAQNAEVRDFVKKNWDSSPSGQRMGVLDYGGAYREYIRDNAPEKHKMGKAQHRLKQNWNRNNTSQSKKAVKGGMSVKDAKRRMQDRHTVAFGADPYPK